MKKNSLTYENFMPNKIVRVFDKYGFDYEDLTQNKMLFKYCDQTAIDFFKIYSKLDWREETLDKLMRVQRDYGKEAFVKTTVVYKEKQPVGAIMISGHDDEITVEYLLVFSQFRNNHIAQDIIKDLIENPKTFGANDKIKNINAFVVVGNDTSSRAFVKAGFNEEKVINDASIKYVAKCKQNQKEM